MNKAKYSITSFDEYFQKLFEDLSARLDPDGFINLQDSLLAEITDKSSYEAKRILQRKINLFQRISQEDKAWNVIENNIQFESFRKQVVEKRIDEGKLQDAKKLIDDFLVAKQEKDYGSRHWFDLLLIIAVKENDKERIKKHAYKFIENHFVNDYYETYKSAFTMNEWIAEREKLFQHYDSSKHFNDSAAELLKAENDSEALLAYLEKHPSLHKITEYYTIFSSAYPERSIELFQKSLNSYAEHNTGRSSYEIILSALHHMEMIDGGKKAAADLAEAFKARYKNRKAMIEVLNQL
jgi:2-oxo-4-hydroxy-4-carboxy--5-ureidoimidazoline (OHCU) decarboxylase